MFTTKGLNTEKKLSKYISYGNHLLRINSIEIKTAQSGSKQLIFHMESPEIKAQGFVPEEGYKGQVGKIAFPGSYLKMDNQTAVKEFNTAVGVIADTLGVRKELDNINAESFDEYVAAIEPLITNKYAWWAVAGEEYIKSDGKIGTKLKVRRYNFISSLEKGEPGLKPFDASLAYNLKKVEAPDSTAVKQDLPF